RSRDGGRVVALTTISPSTSAADQNDARAFVQRVGTPHIWTASQEFENGAYLKNDENRCYHCKAELFRITAEKIAELECRFVAYGYTASDRGDDRPGHRAALENNVRAPLDEADLEKDDIRILMRAHQLPFYDKPASPCLSSRLMRGVTVTNERLRAVEAVEQRLQAMGLALVRARLHSDHSGEWVRVEVDPKNIEEVTRELFALRELAQSLGLSRIEVDPRGYRMGGANV
ncbi:MAG TPA: TIGR00268 family protein, partial [Oligoflexia bacterium]|nr:TIGR00268 family protein [Oligoflexia bacterium]